MDSISVIIPAYNCAATVDRSIASALAQDYDGSLEVIVINDGSTDETLNALGKYSERIIVITQTNQGLARSRNVGVARARGDLLAFLDADDVWFPSKLSQLSSVLEHNEHAVLAYSNIVAVDGDGLVLPQKFIGDAFMHAPSMGELLAQWWPILPSTVIMRRKAFQQCGGFCEDYRRAYEDVDLWLRAREIGHFIFVPERLVLYRMTSAGERMIKYSGDYAVFEKQIRERYRSRARKLLSSTRRAYVSSLGFQGLVALREGNRRTARQAFMAALRYDPCDFSTMLRLGRTILPWPLVRLLSGSRRLKY